MTDIQRLSSFNQEDLRNLNALLLQLSSRGHQMAPEDFKKALAQENVYVLAMRDNNKIIGTATLVALLQITGYKGYIEDFVVDQDYRGRGLGTQLMQYVISLAKELHIFRLELKSEIERKAANNLYPKLGFEKKSANVYQLIL